MVGDRFHLLDMLRGYDAERIGDLDADDTRLATRPALDPRGRSESLVRGADEGAVLARLRADVRSSRRAVLAAGAAQITRSLFCADTASPGASSSRWLSMRQSARVIDEPERSGVPGAPSSKCAGMPRTDPPPHNPGRDGHGGPR